MQTAQLSNSMLPRWNITRAIHMAVALVVALVGFTSRADAGIKSQRQLAAIKTHTPAAQLVSDGEQLKHAEKMAAQIKNAFALLGAGQSMEPLYAANTAVVVAPIKCDDIKKGMTVVYVKRNGRRVAHSVIGETRGGFLVQGINNDEADAEVVNEKNLLGVIVQAYASTETNFGLNGAPKLASSGMESAIAKSSI